MGEEGRVDGPPAPTTTLPSHPRHAKQAHVTGWVDSRACRRARNIRKDASREVSVTSGTTLLAGTDGGVFHSSDSGVTLTPATTQPTNMRVLCGATLLAGTFGYAPAVSGRVPGSRVLGVGAVCPTVPAIPPQAQDRPHYEDHNTTPIGGILTVNQHCGDKINANEYSTHENLVTQAGGYEEAEQDWDQAEAFGAPWDVVRSNHYCGKTQCSDNIASTCNHIRMTSSD
jgi:hypothetical protein